MDSPNINLYFFNFYSIDSFSFLLKESDTGVFHIITSSLAIIPLPDRTLSAYSKLKGNINVKNYVRISSPFSKNIVSQLVGHLLGDGSLVLSKTSTSLFLFLLKLLKDLITFGLSFNNYSVIVIKILG